MSTVSVAAMLAEAREYITRIEARELRACVAVGALVVDIRPERQRHEEGSLDFGIVVERNVLEWRFDLSGPDCLQDIGDDRRHVIVICSEGYASSLAAASLRRLGYVNASDLIGGFRAWAAWRQRTEPRRFNLPQRGFRRDEVDSPSA